MTNHTSERGTDELEKGLKTTTTQAGSQPEVTTADEIEGWILDAVENWEQDANTAILRAWQSLEYTGGGSVTPTSLGISLGSSFLSSLSPWAATAVGVLFSGILPSPPGLNLDEVRGKFEEGVKEMARQLASEAPSRARALYSLSQRSSEDWNAHEIRREALTSVISSEFLRSAGSRPSINHSDLQASLELGLLLDIAAMDLKGVGGFGGRYPLITFEIEYIMDPITTYDGPLATTPLNDGVLAAIHKWKWRRYKFDIQTYGLKKYKGRIQTLLARLNRRLDVGTRSIPLSASLKIPGVGEFEYLGHTQPPVSVVKAEWKSDEIREEVYSMIALSFSPLVRFGETRDEQFLYAVITEAIWQGSLLPPIPYS